MLSGVRDIQFLKLKDTISQLNNTISTQNRLICSLRKMLHERDAKDSEKDQLTANLQAQLDYLKARLFGFTSEIRYDQLPEAVRPWSVGLSAAQSITSCQCMNICTGNC